ncbi:helix-turn-helix domain-containing protein [Laceyella tengchongensis]|uniref:helix-turn-helix domain-containing protein n=1 Tax=Laceyella tengchongensis TaxID=574699 RepID=UPI0012B8916B|nr:helix-turn-helix domain-containing protein [Laceyella tengchongensis]
MMKYHYGLTIREGREKLKMTQTQLAEKWPQAGGGTGVSVNYVSDVERGIKHISDPQTLRRLCRILQIPLWKMGLSDYDPFNPSTKHPNSNQENANHNENNGIVKLTDSPFDRILDYKNCLVEAKGDCFISGTSMIHLTDDSSDILQAKLATGNIYLLILNPDWIERNASILTFIEDDEYRQEFHHEIRNSIRKLNQLRKSLPQDLISRLKIKTYSTVFPYIVTGFDDGETGKLVFEITDYIPEKKRPRFTLHKLKGKHTLFEQVKNKFFSIWNNHSISKEI